MLIKERNCSFCNEEKEIVHTSKPEWTTNKEKIEKLTKYFRLGCLLDNDNDGFWNQNS